jgi:hypothetical protein
LGGALSDWLPCVSDTTSKWKDAFPRKRPRRKRPRRSRCGTSGPRNRRAAETEKLVLTKPAKKMVRPEGLTNRRRPPIPDRAAPSPPAPLHLPPPILASRCLVFFRCVVQPTGKPSTFTLPDRAAPALAPPGCLSTSHRDPSQRANPAPEHARAGEGGQLGAGRWARGVRWGRWWWLLWPCCCSCGDDAGLGGVTQRRRMRASSWSPPGAVQRHHHGPLAAARGPWQQETPGGSPRQRGGPRLRALPCPQRRGLPCPPPPPQWPPLPWPPVTS